MLKGSADWYFATMFLNRFGQVLNEYRKEIAPFLFIIILHALSVSHSFLEHIYGARFFQNFGLFVRYVLGKIPFSVGDCLYFLLILIILYLLFKTLFKRFYLKISALNWRIIIRSTGWIGLSYTLLWGLQYKQVGLAEKWQLPRIQYGKTELLALNQQLVSELNQLKTAIDTSKTPEENWATIAADAYFSQRNNKDELFIPEYSLISIKKSIWTPLMNAWGISGYYNPWTGEAQVNDEMPAYLKPFVATHEIAHQLGIAREQEANLLGLVIADRSENPMLRYSAEFHLYLYAYAALYTIDSSLAKSTQLNVNARVRQDLIMYKNYLLKNQSFWEPLISAIYHQFLIKQGQKRGMNSYSDVVGLWLAYVKKKELVVKN